jgi:hypothetical protein
MHPKPYALVFILIAVLILQVPAYSQECDLDRPGLNLCDGGQTAWLSNTTNSVTIHDAGRVPTSGTYTATIYYYKQSVFACQGPYTCSGASVNSSGADITISLGSCITLPANFSSEGIVRINLTNGPAGESYFFHIYGGACMLPLPITLQNFGGSPIASNGNKVMRLTWETVSEQNSLRFDIMRSTDNGYTFYKIGQVAAAGNSNSLLYYSFTDPYYLLGQNLYKLSMVDIDGTCESSPIIWRTCNSETGAACASSLPGPFNCGYSINGPSAMCDWAPAQFSLSSAVPDYSTIAWSVSPSDAATITVNSCDPGQIQLNKANYYQSITLTASLSRCNYAISRQINFSSTPTGTYANSGNVRTLYTDNSGSPGGFEINMNCPNCTNMQWERIEGSNFYSVSQGGLMVNFWISAGQYMGLRFTGSNECGPFDQQFYFDASGGDWLVSPNPATSFVTIKGSSQGASAKRTQDTRIRQIQLLDAYGVLQKTIPGKYSDQMQINVSDMRPGYYLLKIFYGNKIQTKKIRVK